MANVLILGATGRFGRAAAAAFAADGWHVTETARRWAVPDAQHVVLDPMDAEALTGVARSADVIVNALNPPYPDWARDVMPLTRAVIEAAKASGATVMIPGNVYNYGAAMPHVLTEQTPWAADTGKGRIRVRMEEAYRAAGVPTIVLRGGDFLEAVASGNWFDAQIAAKAWKGRVVYPGPLDAVHAWAWVPDMARAMAHLAQQRTAFAPFEEFGFEGYALTGRALVDLIEDAVGQKMRVSGLPWPVVRLMGVAMPMMREVAEMRYLWNRPHRIDGAKLAQTLPDFKTTPPHDAIAAAVGALRQTRQTA